MEEIGAAFDIPMQVGECPLWHPDEAALYWIDITGQAVHRLDPANGTHDSWTMPSEPGCIAHCASGGMVVALRSGLMLLDTASGALTPLLDAPYDSSKLRFNDGRCDAAGRLWTGTMYEPRDQQLGSLFCIERGTIRDWAKAVTVSNGVAFSPDNRTLYHADSREWLIGIWSGFLATYLVLTFIGTSMRGPGMDLFAPWALPKTHE